MSAKRADSDLRWGARMAALDNVLKLVEPLLVLACASLYAGGDWGSFKLAESTAYLLFRLSLLGLDRGVVWWFGRAGAAAYREDLFASLGAVLFASLCGSAALVAISVHAPGAVAGLALPFGQVLMIAASIPLLAVSEVLYQANLNQRDAVARILGKNVVLPVVTFGGALLGKAFHGPGLAAFLLLGCAANAAVALVSFLSIHSLSWRDLVPRLPRRELLAYSAPLTGSDLLAGLSTRIDLMLVGALADIRAVELYNVVTMIGRSLQGIRESFDAFLFSSFSREGTARLTAPLRERLNFATWCVGNLMGLALLAVVWWGRDLLPFLGKGYADGFPALLAMAALSYANIFGDMSGLMLQGLGRSRAWTIAQLAGFAANVALNLWWIPILGPLGGVLALKISQFAQGLACQLLLHREDQGRIWLRDYLESYAGFAATLAALGAVSLVLQPPMQVRIPLFFAVAAVWAAVYRNVSLDLSRRFAPDFGRQGTAWYE